MVTLSNKETVFQQLLQQVIEKLKNDPTTITREDARRLHEHFDVKDERSAHIISAIEAIALANPDIMAEDGGKAAAPEANGKVCLLTLVKDLHATVDANPDDVTVEVLKLAQGIVSKMQKAIGHINAPHSELEDELQKEYAEIEPKIFQGVVTKQEADHLHSLESRAHGHTEKGGLTAAAQSVVAKRERAVSLSEPFGDSDHTTPAKGDSPIAIRNRKHSIAAELKVALQEEKAKIEPKVKEGTVTKDEADYLQSLEVAVHGHTEKGSLTAVAQSVAAKREKALSDKSNNQGSNGEAAVSEKAGAQRVNVVLPKPAAVEDSTN